MAGAVTLYLILILGAVITILKRQNNRSSGAKERSVKSRERRQAEANRDMADTGLPGELLTSRADRMQDVTCETQYGHHHEKSKTEALDARDRYTGHEEPTEGYIILNGKKMRLKDADKQ